MRLLIAILASSVSLFAGQVAPVNGWIASDTAGKSVPLRRDFGDSVTLQFPTHNTRPDTVCVLAHSNNGSLQGKTISATFHIVSAPNIVWWGGYQGGCTTTPPNMRLYFTTRTGNFNLNYSDSKDPSSVWWYALSGVAMADVDDGVTYTMTAELDPAQWTNAHGQAGTSLPADWSRATSTAVQVGFGFGIGCFYDTGVNDYYGVGAVLHVESLTIQ